MSASARVSPYSQPILIELGSSTIGQTALDKPEVNLFNRDFSRLCMMYSLQSDLTNLLFGDYSAYLTGAAIAKQQFGGIAFKGVQSNDSSSFGIQLIRAITVMNPAITSGTPKQDWVQTFNSTGWQNIFGPLSLAQTGLGSGSATQLYNRVLLMFSALVNKSASPLLKEYQLTLNKTTYGVESISWVNMTNLYYTKLAYAVLVGQNGTFSLAGNIQPSTGTQDIELFGITYAKGDYLASQS